MLARKQHAVIYFIVGIASNCKSIHGTHFCCGNDMYIMETWLKPSIILALCFGAFLLLSKNTNNTSPLQHRVLTATDTPIRVYYDSTASRSPLFRKFQSELNDGIEAIPLDVHAPPSFLQSCSGAPERVAGMIEAHQPHLALEVLKYCALQQGGVYVDAASSVLMDTLEHLHQGRNVAVLNDPFLPASIHGALLVVQNSKIPKSMLEILLTTKLETLISTPTLLPKSLYDLVATEVGVETLSVGKNGPWYLLQHTCIMDPLGGRQVTAPISTYALQSYR